jgi:hypothetical protein
MVDDTLVDLAEAIANAKKACSLAIDFDYSHAQGEIQHLVYLSLEIAERLRAATIKAHVRREKLVFAREIPAEEKEVLLNLLERIKSDLTAKSDSPGH